MASDMPVDGEAAKDERAKRAGEQAEARAKRKIKRVQDEIAFGKPTERLEWDSIRKLDYPPPRWWVLTFWGTFVFAVVWWILYPSWPGTRTYFPGLLGYDQRAAVDEQLSAAQRSQARFVEAIAATPLDQIVADQELLGFALVGGRAAFNETCAQCHGLGGAGQGFFPTLADDDWLWGGGLEDVQHTVTHGVRNGGEEARDSQMPRFGADQILTREQVADVVEYVRSLAGQDADADAAARGEPLFAENCVACHGEGGVGMPEMGAPSLNDAIWLYGDEREQQLAQVWSPRHGVMPAFGDRLDPATIKMLAVYVHSLGGGQ
jgi:cytochrome c oxidase cbb3-type subunit III